MHYITVEKERQYHVSRLLYIYLSNFLFNFYLKFGYPNLRNLILDVLPDLTPSSFCRKFKLREEIKAEILRNGINPFQREGDK